MWESRRGLRCNALENHRLIADTRMIVRTWGAAVLRPYIGGCAIEVDKTQGWGMALQDREM